MSLERRSGGALRRRLLRVAAIAGLGSLLGLAGCNRVPDVVKIGVGQPLTGRLASQGQDLLNGATLAVEEINAAGGVNIDGKKVKFEVVSGDDMSKPEAGEAVAHRLVDDGVEVAIADLDSAVSIQAAPVYAAAGIPQFALSTKPDYTRLGLPTTLRLVANDELQSRALGAYSAQLPGSQLFAVVDDGTPYGRGMADNAAKAIVELGKKVVLRKSLDNRGVDFSALLPEIRAAKADVIVTTLADFQVEPLAAQLVRAGMGNMTIVGGDSIKTERLLGKTPGIRAIYATSPIVEAREFASGKEFLEKFRQRFKSDPVYGAHYAYDAVYLVADALSRNAKVDKTALLKTLKEFDGNCPVTDSMRFGPDGEQRYGSIAVYQLRNGAWEPLVRSDHW